MFSNGITSLGLEKPGLLFLAILMDDDHNPDDEIRIQTEFGAFVFEGAELVQDRGQLPRLLFRFSMDQKRLVLSYYGHVSPFKLNYVEIQSAGDPRVRYTYLDQMNTFDVRLSAADMASMSICGMDIKNITTSLYLWRSCIGLPRVFEAGLAKYFTKMKPVSRYQWTNVACSQCEGSVVEKWTSVIGNSAAVHSRVSVTLRDGVVSDVLFKRN